MHSLPDSEVDRVDLILAKLENTWKEIDFKGVPVAEQGLTLVAVIVQWTWPSQSSGLKNVTVYGSKMDEADNNFENGGKVSNTKSSLSSRTRHEFIPSIATQQGMNFEGPIPLCPCCKRPSLYHSQHSRTAYKCSYCHAVFPESWVIDYLPMEDSQSTPQSEYRQCS